MYGNLYEESFEDIIYGERAKLVTKKIEEEVDVSKCISYCRHHSTNMFLTNVAQKVAHKNYI